jgi:hypothetical protein
MNSPARLGGQNACLSRTLNCGRRVDPGQSPYAARPAKGDRHEINSAKMIRLRRRSRALELPNLMERVIISLAAAKSGRPALEAS